MSVCKIVGGTRLIVNIVNLLFSVLVIYISVQPIA